MFSRIILGILNVLSHILGISRFVKSYFGYFEMYDFVFWVVQSYFGYFEMCCNILSILRCVKSHLGYFEMCSVVFTVF